jgi:avirulence protein
LYGRSFFQNTRIAGQLLADGKLGSFRELWHHASEWRMTTVASGNSQAFKPQPSRMPGETSFTTLSDQYEYFAERLEKQEGVPAQVEFLLAADSPYSDHPEQIPKIESTRHQQFGQIGSEKIPLTRVDFGHAKEEEREFLEQFTDSVLFLTHSLVHTDPKHIPKIVEHVESLFVRVTSGNRLPQENLTDLAEMHWWLANAMPDRRGSAAKTEFCIRSLAYANGIELPPFQRGILPDMESFDPSLSCADFVEKYKTEFFTWVLKK